MSKELLLLVDILAKEKNLDNEIVFQSLESALSYATKKTFLNESPTIVVVIDRTTGKYRTVRKWVVVSDIDFYDDDKELSLRDATEKYGECNIGDVFEEELDNVDLGRVSAQTAREVINQRIRQAEKHKVLQDFLINSEGIISGRVKKVEHNNIIIDCGKIEAIIMKKDLIPKEVIRPGDNIKGYVDKNKIIIKNGKLVLTRTSNDFLLKLFEIHIPEISNKRVEIKAVVREPGVRSKVAVISNEKKIDAKSACIGIRNQRILGISKELSDENIDIIDYSSDIAQFAMNALAPAKIKSLVVDEEKKIIDVIVSDDKLGLAIGQDGVNVRLASGLIQFNINLLSETEAKSQSINKQDDLNNFFMHELDVEHEISEILVANGFTTLEEVAYVVKDELLSIEDFDEDIVEELQSRAKNKVLSKNILFKDDMDRLSEELKNIVKFSRKVLLNLIENDIMSLKDFADLSCDELVEIINIDSDTANKLILKARELSGYFK